MTPDDFKQLIQYLTGTPVKPDTNDGLLAAVLNDELQSLDMAQFNELLLLVNKDRVEKPFFEHFFGRECSVAKLADGVAKFQIAAMLRYGNFIFAYRTLSRISDRGEFDSELGEMLNGGVGQADEFQGRSKTLIGIEEIPREDTPLVGHIASGQIEGDAKDAKLLLKCLADIVDELTWERLDSRLAKVGESGGSVQVVAKYREQHPTAEIKEFARDLLRLFPPILERADRLLAVREKATRNQDIYLTWDHMDVYFATSMRKAWEFADLYDFVHQVVDSIHLRELNLRYFDPTQCFTVDRIDKGLVESLMLKRAKCTVYSVQDTDTLGKDSELAATLAQGKPVIAYVPHKPVAERAHELEQEDPSTILDRLRFIMYADDVFSVSLSSQDLAFVDGFKELPRFVSSRLFRSGQGVEEVQRFRGEYRAELSRLCWLIAESEKRIYDRRARTLQKDHPLGIQVNLDTGVANGVLVVRSAEKCARLLRAILTRSMDCYPRYNAKENMWELRERISGSIFRVVTGNKKINNCFWNFYLRNDKQRN